MWSVISLVLLLSSELIFCEQEEEKNAETLSKDGDFDQWIDPHNMVDEQDTGLGSWIKKGISSIGAFGEKNPDAAITSAFSNLQDELNECKKKLLTAVSSPGQEAIEEGTSCDTPYFKQLVRVLHEATSDINPHTEINLNPEYREILKKFLNDKANIHDVFAILLGNISNRTMSNTFMDNYTVFISSYLNTGTLILFMCVVMFVMTVAIFEMTTNLTARQQFIYLVVVSFIISIPWEWYRLYKKEFAKKQSIMMERLQKYCHTDHELGPFESATLWWKSTFSAVDDPCGKYQEALLVDPIWEVAPSMAVSVTLTRFFLQPLEHIADATGKSFRALFQHLPIQWQPLMFLACLIIIIICLILVSGLHISTPFFQIGVGVDHGIANGQLQRIENQMNELLQENAENQNRPAIENLGNNDPNQNIPAIENLGNNDPNQNGPAIENIGDNDPNQNGPAIGDNDQRLQAVLDLTRAINEKSDQQAAQLREIKDVLQQLRQEGLEQGHQAEAVENHDWELVGGGTRVPEERHRIKQPVQDSEHKPTENIGPRI